MKLLQSIIRADYLQRTRSYSFLIVLLASVCMAYSFVPAADATYSTVRIGDFIGEQNAAWIGHVTAVMASTFLWLIGFYLVNDGLHRDKQTGVGQIIATTSISNFKYLLAKALSNFLVLLTIALVVMVIALGLVVARGHQYSFNTLQFVLPYLLATVPAVFCVSVLAVFAEIVLGRFTTLQNIAFFFLFPLVIGLQKTYNYPGMFWFDVLGTKYISDEMITTVNNQFNQSIETVQSGFLIVSQANNKYFVFEGTHWSADYVLSRVLWIVAGFLLLYLSSLLFKRFDIKEGYTIKKNSTTAAKETKLSLREIQLSTLPVATPSFGIWPFLKTELLMLVRVGPRWFWLINAGGFIALFFIPLTAAHQFGLPLLWFLQVNRWADIATKEKYNRTHYFAYAAFKPLQRLLTAQIIAGILLAIVFSIPLLLRHAIAGNFVSVLSILLGAVFLIALSVCSGIVSGGKRLFEIAFFMLTYANVNAATILDYFGGFTHGIVYIPILFIVTCMLLLTAYLFRGYEISHQ